MCMVVLEMKHVALQGLVWRFLNVPSWNSVLPRQIDLLGLFKAL